MFDIEKIASIYKKIKDGTATKEDKMIFEADVARLSIEESILIEMIEKFIEEDSL